MLHSWLKSEGVELLLTLLTTSKTPFSQLTSIKVLKIYLYDIYNNPFFLKITLISFFFFNFSNAAIAVKFLQLILLSTEPFF